MQHRTGQSAPSLLALSILAALPAWPGIAQAQESVAPPAASGTVVYDEAYFAPYKTSTAEEMLRRVPGAGALLDAASAQQQQRGLGSGGAQILIDGKRIAGKTNDITMSLRRIPAASVLRVELIRGASAEVDVQSEGLLVNIVLKAARAAANGAWELNARFNDQDAGGLDGLVSYSSAWGALTYDLAIERNLWSPASTPVDWSNRGRAERYYLPNGALRELREQVFDREHDKRIYTANFGLDLGRAGQLKLNSFYQTLWIYDVDETPLERLDASGAVILRATDHHERIVDTRHQHELGFEHEVEIGPGTLTSILISARLDGPTDDSRVRREGGRWIEVSRSLNHQATGEDILRSAYSWRLAPGHQVEVGGEAAKNTLEQNLAVYFDLDADGRVENLPIPTARAEVEELRAEAFVKYTWNVNAKLSLEPSLNVEFSRIATNYPLTPQREYVYPKPRLDLRYSVNAANQVRLAVARTVSQLDFVNFVPVYDPVDDEIDAGNPALEPEKTWSYEAGWEHRLGADQGVLEGRLFYKDITGHIDKVIIGRDVRGRPISALGNIDKATVYGLEAKASVRLSRIGLSGAVLNLRYLRNFSETSDPFTGRSRRVRSYWDQTTRNVWDYELELGLRHDITDLGLSYGFNFRDYGGIQLISDVVVQEFYDVGAKLDLFIEKKLPRNLALRAELSGLTRSPEYRSRLLYSDSVMAGSLSRREYYEEARDRRFAIKLRGKF